MVHHNVSWENIDFIELGDARTADTLVAYNRDASTLARATFLVVHGRGQRYGPTARTVVLNNTSYLSGADGFAVSWTGGCGPDILCFRDNIVWAEDRVGHSTDAFDEGGDL